MIRHTFTVQVFEKEPFERWRIVYEGPVEKNATLQFAKRTRWALVFGCVFRVELKDKMVYEGGDQAVAKSMFYALARQISEKGKFTWSTAFIVRNGDKAVRFTVRPVEERLMGGDPQSGVSRTQFSDPD